MSCYYCQSDLQKSWKRLKNAAQNPTNQWICEDSDNSNHQVKVIFCLSSRDPLISPTCETKGRTLLCMIQNDTRDFVGVALECNPMPNGLLNQNKIARIIKPLGNGFFANHDSICHIDIDLEQSITKNNFHQVTIHVLRDYSSEKKEISPLIENFLNLSIVGKPNTSITTVG